LAILFQSLGNWNKKLAYFRPLSHDFSGIGITLGISLF